MVMPPMMCPSFPGTFRARFDINNQFNVVMLSILWIIAIVLTVAVIKDAIDFIRKEREQKAFYKKIEGDHHRNGNE